MAATKYRSSIFFTDRLRGPAAFIAHSEDGETHLTSCPAAHQMFRALRPALSLANPNFRNPPPETPGLQVRELAVRPAFGPVIPAAEVNHRDRASAAALQALGCPADFPAVALSVVPD